MDDRASPDEALQFDTTFTNAAATAPRRRPAEQTRRLRRTRGGHEGENKNKEKDKDEEEDKNEGDKDNGEANDEEEEEDDGGGEEDDNKEKDKEEDDDGGEEDDNKDKDKEEDERWSSFYLRVFKHRHDLLVPVPPFV